MSKMSTGCLAIIRKMNRTEADRREAFEILFNKQNSASRHLKYEDIKDFDKILDNLRMLSKSRLMLCRFCPYKFKCKYIFAFEPETPLQIMRF
jgi:uncharacterized Fe-S radical SAM superfamily protein PflX